ncbi:hypothetical protein GCK72_021301 [Caenorhabditis remanei]|uniref:ShKT domain-containing protein n=1 Tax=Caenorhabditis remanei TaxID=31234 RepID=A0A6A5GHR2_CAERE|nr:hypothetical protein GCK72_021301 [Caenorhabditis remanei]KAF1754737.1 hypothetical protein GCK72_021301 [Caenorhabditis remanei]
MLFLVVLAVFGVQTDARIDPQYLPCAVHNGSAYVYSRTAANCLNVMSDAYCEIAYSKPTPDESRPAEGNDAQRSLMCYTLGYATPAPANADAESVAVASCPKTCGVCCLTSAYKCNNRVAPRVNCATVSKAMCLSPIWRQILAEDCPAECGFCDLNGCIDLVVGCENDPMICYTAGLEDFVNTNCRRTCNKCNVQPPCPGGGR